LRYATFQPTFLYEIIWNLSLAAVLAWLVRRHRFRAPGAFALYVAGYSGFRLFEESLRIDYSNYVLGMRLNFWIALLVCLAALLWFVAIQRRWDLKMLLPGRRARRATAATPTSASAAPGDR
jgi:prolipoprotein diacylglyceryltransferase